ncbi:SIR2 family NAD-dependent protein deacylase [Virgibacillus senegalensis]|uniref:SIR2 family NAD-dependent protein deacylase n=1 Tax=Virgibacillus senegalensis TaxID=1499679 RepID=UPI00069D06D1|nr:SIR2 family protein [Virgibacillus senegalensis]
MSLDSLIQKILNNEVIIWAGAGFSLYAGMPAVEEIKQEVKRFCSRPEWQLLKSKKHFPDMVEEFIRLRNGSRTDIIEILTMLIDKEPASLNFHKMLADIPAIDTIITTNYDQLFEMAYGRRLATVFTDAQLEEADKQSVRLFKIHGDIQNPESMVISSGDYADYELRNTRRIWQRLKSLAARKSILFIGYSFADEDNDFLISNVLKHLEKNEQKSYLVTPEMPQLKLTHLKRKNIEPINITGEELVYQLHQQINGKDNQSMGV